MFSGVNIPLAWGATAITQNIIAFMDMPAKSSVLGGSSSGGQIGAWRFSKDSATNDVILNSLGYKSDTTNRRYLKGNTVTHQFKFNCLWKNTGDTGYKAFRATGYSEGAGKYYLIQAKINGSAGGQPTLDGTNARRHQRSTTPTLLTSVLHQIPRLNRQMSQIAPILKPRLSRKSVSIRQAICPPQQQIFLSQLTEYKSNSSC